MTDLILEKFQCIEETNEVGSDSPYFVIFVGHSTSGKSELVFIREEAWDNESDTGDLPVKVNKKVASNVGGSTLVLVALLEEDVNPDLVGGDFDKVKHWVQEAFNSVRASGSATTSKLATQVAPEFVKAINANIGNDELLGVKYLETANTPQSLPPLTIKGDGGEYSIKFKLA